MISVSQMLDSDEKREFDLLHTGLHVLTWAP